jgi:hypothetical protein
MATYVICKNRQGRKVELAVCLTNCKEQLLCDNFNEVPRETISAAAKRLGLVSETPESEPVINVDEEETEELAENEEVKSDTPQIQEEFDDTDVPRDPTERPPMVPSDSKAQRLYRQVLSLKAEIEVRWFELGKILEEIFEGRHYIDLGYSTWRDFCVVALGSLDLKPRAIDYLRMTRKKCDEVDIGREIAGEIGWSKLKEIIPVVTKKNKDHWIDMARQKETTVQVLNAKVRVARGKITEEESKILPEKMFFSLFKEQKKIVELALDRAGMLVGSEKPDKPGSLLSDVICPSFLAEYPVEVEVGSRPEVIAKLLGRFEEAFKIKFTGDVLDAETGEILAEGRK